MCLLYKHNSEANGERMKLALQLSSHKNWHYGTVLQGCVKFLGMFVCALERNPCGTSQSKNFILRIAALFLLTLLPLFSHSLACSTIIALWCLVFRHGISLVLIQEGGSRFECCLQRVTDNRCILCL